VDAEVNAEANAEAVWQNYGEQTKTCKKSHGEYYQFAKIKF